MKFVPFASAIESAFWVRYCRDKLETIHLNETPIPLRLTYGVNHHTTSNTTNETNTTTASAPPPQVPPRLQCHDRSLLLTQNQQNQQLEQNQVNDETVTTTSSTSTASVQASTATTTCNKWTNNECVYVHGDMIGYNTLESFQKVDKNQFLYDYFVQRFFPSPTNSSSDTDIGGNSTIDTTATIDHTTDLQIVQSLNCAVLITYADLKSHSVVYWFGMPTLVPQASVRATVTSAQHGLLDTLHETFHSMRRDLLQSSSSSSFDGGLPPYFIYYYNPNDDDGAASATCLPLSVTSYNTICAKCGTDFENVYFGFVDPLLDLSSNDTNDDNTKNSSSTIPYMGWPMRNMIAYMSMYLHLGGQDVSIISYRSKVIRRMDMTAADAPGEKDYCSIVLNVRIPSKEEYLWNNTTNNTDTIATTSTSKPQFKIVGWELNARYKAGPRSVNLRPLLDSNHLAIQAADLNLKLMKWRMIPNLQVEQLQSTKALLIGAGTLGCNVARVLLGWGIRNIKILDYGKVSYSNPVRQSLFTIQDCNAENGTGRMKAIAAADALKTIAADVVSEGIVLSIPMPGHPDKEDVIGHAVEMLDALIQEADVVYLLTDTRESRWLPTVMCSAYNKVLINAALGLDSWLVMRHGASRAENVVTTERDTSQSISNHPYRLGCYFCSDVVAPENSTKNRTLDQQCTVTRPGLALIASSMAVELMVSLLHHPKQILAPAPKNTNNTNTQYSPTISSNDADVAAASSTLGIIPHSIRGSLVSYTMMTPTIPAFQYCTGCSKTVTDSYLTDKLNFVQQSCQTTDGSYLEKVSGLTAFRLAAAEKLVDMEGWENDE